MKKAILVLGSFLFIVNYSCNKKIDFEKEKEAILAVSEEEAAGTYGSDFERWSATYLQDSTNIRILASKTGFVICSGWDEVSSYVKADLAIKRIGYKEVRTPIRIKIYEESAWFVFDNEVFNNKGELVWKQIQTNFLEKHDGSWKIVYKNAIGTYNYSQADLFLLMAISYAKSLGKNVEDLAKFAGENVKTSWNQANGFNGLVTGMLRNWRAVAPRGELKIKEQDDNHIVFSVNKMFSGLKNTPQYNVTYDDYLTFYKGAGEQISDYMGGIYKLENTQDGMLVTISKK